MKKNATNCDRLQVENTARKRNKTKTAHISNTIQLNAKNQQRSHTNGMEKISSKTWKKAKPRSFAEKKHGVSPTSQREKKNLSPRFCIIGFLFFFVTVDARIFSSLHCQQLNSSFTAF